MHYTRLFSNTNFSIGASFERIVFNPKHSTFGLVLAYQVIHNLDFTVSPGLAFEDNQSGGFLSVHIETAYQFELGKIHIGPAIEFAIDPNDYHLGGGIHLGYGF